MVKKDTLQETILKCLPEFIDMIDAIEISNSDGLNMMTQISNG